MTAKLKCPQCHGPSAWDGNPNRPFCSERCKLIDLGSWLKGEHRIPDDSQKLSEEEAALLEKQAKDSTIH